jgi:hypothetical protein
MCEISRLQLKFQARRQQQPCERDQNAERLEVCNLKVQKCTRGAAALVKLSSKLKDKRNFSVKVSQLVLHHAALRNYSEF